MSKRITIPNILSIFRMVLIPVFVLLYLNTGIENHYWYAAGVIVLSGFTDVADGFIARRFNMCSELGKILDPAADKLTQAAVLICLCFKHSEMVFLAILLFCKELILLAGAIVLRKKEQVKMPSARWWGKLSTVIIYATVFTVVLSDIFTGIPKMVTGTLIMLSVFSVAFSFAGYYFKIYRELRTS